MHHDMTLRYVFNILNFVPMARRPYDKGMLL